jgi:hypothetical protein
VIQPVPDLPPAVTEPNGSSPAVPTKTRAKVTPPVVGHQREQLTPISVEPPIRIQQMSALESTPEFQSITHAENYSWVQGELHYVHVRGGMWIVRYLPLDQFDRNGGSVVLAADAKLDTFREGDVVRISGEIIRDRSESSLGGPLYRLRTIKLVSRGLSP